MSDFTIFSHLCCLAMVLNIYHASHGYNSDTQLHGGNYHPILKNLLSIQTNSLLTKIRHFVKFQDTGCDVHTDIAVLLVDSYIATKSLLAEKQHNGIK